jgi:hypothetical protein
MLGVAIVLGFLLGPVVLGICLFIAVAKALSEAD